MQRIMSQASSGPPVLGIHVLMGEQAPVMLKNVQMGVASGALTPVELVAVAS
jgi:hypothetical protein